jgi:hypothetical protein
MGVTGLSMFAVGIALIPVLGWYALAFSVVGALMVLAAAP